MPLPNNNKHSCILRISKTLFFQCKGREGGGVAALGGLLSFFHLYFVDFFLYEVQCCFDDCVFDKCCSWAWGGGIYAQFWKDQNFTRCIFTECKAETVFFFLFFAEFIKYYFLDSVGSLRLWRWNSNKN
jgi:hypothetical protein